MTRKVKPDHVLVLSVAYNLDSYKSNFKIPVSLNSYAQNIQIHTYIHVQFLPPWVEGALPSPFTGLTYRQGTVALLKGLCNRI